MLSTHTDADRARLDAFCTNCGAPLRGPFCHACGQRHRDRLLPLRTLVADGLDHLFSLDNRLMRSLRGLVVSPGELTEAYLAGRRQPYLSPLRLYLVVSVAYFFVLAVLVGRLPIAGADSEVALRLVQHMPKAMFLLVPAYAAILALMFWRNGRLFVEHLVFALHLHSLAFLLLTAQSLLVLVLPVGSLAQDAAQAESGLSPTLVIVGLVQTAIQLVLLVYAWRAMRRVYADGPVATTVKLLISISLYMALVVAGAQAFVTAGFGAG